MRNEYVTSLRNSFAVQCRPEVRLGWIGDWAIQPPEVKVVLTCQTVAESGNTPQHELQIVPYRLSIGAGCALATRCPVAQRRHVHRLLEQEAAVSSQK